jgi:DNA-directed RNA polymerase subunit RPC12/RpoP
MSFWKSIFGSKKTQGEAKEPRQGDGVSCQRCGKKVTVRYQRPGGVAIAVQSELATTALRCQQCGYVTCVDCATPGGAARPTCPSCRTVGGPFFFTH